jgi:hypothetical protein
MVEDDFATVQFTPQRHTNQKDSFQSGYTEYAAALFVASLVAIIIWLWQLDIRANESFLVHPKITWKTWFFNKIMLWPMHRFQIGVKFQSLHLSIMKQEAIEKEHKLFTEGEQPDFGDSWYEESWSFIFHKANSSRQRTSPVGHLLMRELFLRRLRVKLRLQHELNGPTIKKGLANYPVVQPIFIVGLVSWVVRDRSAPWFNCAALYSNLIVLTG